MESNNFLHINGPHYPTFDYIHERLFKSKGFGMVYTSSDGTGHPIYLRNINIRPIMESLTSVVICTVGRKESLDETLKSLTYQTYYPFEVILVTEKGDLSTCRKKGLEAATGEIVCLIDDDVYCHPKWLESVINTFENDSEIVGVTGPTTIPSEKQNNRDLFKYRFITWLYELIFCNNTKPSHLSKSGAPSLLSNYSWCNYEGKADYLEACNFSCRRSVALGCGGFSSDYKRTSEWCELDLAFRLKEKGVLWFSKEARLEHRPSQAGVYKERLDTKHRYENLLLFHKRWVKPCFRSWLYKRFMQLYFKLKEIIK